MAVRPRNRKPPPFNASDAQSMARYNKWYSSIMYNDRNSAQRNAKTRERMARLRAKRALESPEVQQRHHEAKLEAQRKYREKNRKRLALKARCRRQLWAFKRAAREDSTLEAAIKDLEPEEDDKDDASTTSTDDTYFDSDDEDNFQTTTLMSRYRCEPCFYPDPGEPATPPKNQKVYLVCGGEVMKPGGYLSWPSADAAYKFVSGATLRSYRNWDLLRAAWHARCDAGAHDHPARSPLVSASSTEQVLSGTAHPSPCGRVQRCSPPLRTYIIDSRSPSPTPVACALVPSGTSAGRSHTRVSAARTPPRLSPRLSDPPPYALFSPLTSHRQMSPAPAQEHCYAVRVGREGEIFSSAAEARARFNALRTNGVEAGFVIASSVDLCVDWINDTPSEAEVEQARIINYADEDRDEEEEGPFDSDSE
ncbi:hypothetical protein K438DRAFT_1971146 [Mycena galopus ATCC 62051]|nr:hypothetical protein K438DRAFT_1971146 [Mycena galopus ATCC 62051]